jgi:hypothetical protein
VANYEIYVMNADGGGVFRVTSNSAEDSAPTWSPDGGRLAFETTRDGQSEIYVTNLDGSGVVRLTANPANDSSPAWSPDGRRIAFASDRDGQSEIYAMDPDGGNPTRVTNDVSDDTNPDWSPDGARIAFESNGTITTMTAAGGERTPLTAGSRPAWSPDGSKIALDLGEELYSVGATGGVPVKLTTAGAVDLVARNASWQAIPLLPVTIGPSSPPAPVPTPAPRPVSAGSSGPGSGGATSRIGGRRQVRFTINHNWRTLAQRTQVVRLGLRGIPARSRVEVRCTGSSCPFRRWTKTGKRRLNLKGIFKSRKLRRGTRIEIRVTKRGLNGAVVQFTTRASGGPVERHLCLKSGAKRPTRRC